METPKIIFQDEAILVLDKPSGWITNSADTTTNQPVVEAWVADNFKFPIFDCFECRHGIVHRLDKETSGILVVAKTEKVFKDLQRQFKERIVHKTYVALVHGKLERQEGVVNAPVGRLPWRRDRFGVLPGGREAVSRYRVVGNYQKDGENYSLVTIMPETGRTHQIRIHMKYLGHPVIADEFYAGRKTARADRRFCPRLFLHAKGIAFNHPATGKEVSFESGLSGDLENTLKLMKSP